MRVLVSGGAGFLGSHLCERLLGDGHEVVALDNFSTGSPNNVAHLNGHSDFSLIRHDICEPLRDGGPFDEVYNLASPASPRDYLAAPIATLLAGSLGTRNMLEVALRDSARFLQASTSECYGDPLQHPQSESYWGNVNPIGPRSPYDEAKRFSEALTMAYHREYGVQTHVARLFNTYGPRMKRGDGRVLPAFLEQALRGEPLTLYGDGAQTRCFCFVSDMIEGLIRLARSDERMPVNLGSPHELTVVALAQLVQQLSGVKCGIRYEALPQDDPKRRRPDIRKARRALGWEPKVSLEEGLGLTLAALREPLPQAEPQLP